MNHLSYRKVEINELKYLLSAMAKAERRYYSLEAKGCNTDTLDETSAAWSDCVEISRNIESIERSMGIYGLEIPGAEIYEYLVWPDGAFHKLGDDSNSVEAVCAVMGDDYMKVLSSLTDKDRLTTYLLAVANGGSRIEYPDGFIIQTCHKCSTPFPVSHAEDPFFQAQGSVEFDPTDYTCPLCKAEEVSYE